MSVSVYDQLRVRRGKLLGRNDLCPCKSGKKYKNCHGKVAPIVRHSPEYLAAMERRKTDKTLQESLEEDNASAS